MAKRRQRRNAKRRRQRWSSKRFQSPLYPEAPHGEGGLDTVVPPGLFAEYLRLDHGSCGHGKREMQDEWERLQRRLNEKSMKIEARMVRPDSTFRMGDL